MASPERLPPAYRFEVGVNALILNKIYNLPLRNPDESGKIRNPSATKHQVTKVTSHSSARQSVQRPQGRWLSAVTRLVGQAELRKPP